MNLPFPTPRLPRRRLTRGGFTLTELMMSTSIGLLVLAGSVTTFLQLNRSFTAVSNYSDIHSDGRRAVDWFAKDMRGVSAITSFGTANFTVVIPTNFNTSGSVTGSKTVRYTYNSGALYRYDSSTGQTSQLATNIYYLSYALYDHVGNSTTITNTAKSVQVDVKLRKFIGSQSQTEEYLSGRYDMRNKP